MKLLIRALRVIFTAYALIIFIASMLILLPAYLIVFTFRNKEQAPHAAHAVSRTWGKVIWVLYFIRFKCHFKNRIDPDKTYVFVANHRSLCDIPCYALSCRNTFRFLAKAELGRIPVFGFIIKNIYVMVERDSKKDRSRSMEAMQKSIETGISVFICPEGTRNITDMPLLPFKDGAFRLAIKMQCPIGVLTLTNSQKLLHPKRPFELSPGIIEGYWEEPIPTAGLSDSDLPALKQKVMHLMTKRLEAGMNVDS